MIHSIADYLRKIAQVSAAPATTVESDPAELFKQISPLLQKMGLQNMVDRSKSTLIPGQVSGNNSLYQLFLRKQAQITKIEIERIKRNEDYLNLIQWNSKAIEVQLWWPYIPPEQPGTPQAPGVTPAVPAAPPK